MSDPGPYLWLIPVLPLAAAVLTGLLGPRFLRQQSHWPCVVACLASCVLAFFVLAAVMQGQGEAQPYYTESGGAVKTYYTWFQVGPKGDQVDVGFTLRADGLTAIMLVTITFIGSLIAIFSVGYMHGDEGYARFFAEIALFIFSMTGLVLANSFLLLYAFWEGVGLCSYLLIGFWFTKPSAAAAARKAFLVTRLGDLGFLIGIILLWINAGHTLDYDRVFTEKTVGGIETGTLTLICLLLFCGAVGKSAQFPLHVWLPDAMEGPTPVSALIHAATMVTAGVYLVARCTPLFVKAPEAQLVVAGIGCITALLAASIALTQNDLKRVLAYSTVSQLGYMFLALGTGVGVVAGIFHLFTHAFFKALLFLAAGSVMHAMGGVIDMRRFSGLRKVMPITHATFLCGAAALAGIPIFSGFWSKDDILASVFHAGNDEANPYRLAYFVMFLGGLVAAVMTAFYTFRAYFMTFWGEERIPHEAGHHAHESPLVMTVPLMILAAGAALIGVIVEPFTHWFSHGLVLHTVGLLEHPQETNLFVVGLSVLIALLGVAAAWWMYVRQPGLAPRIAGDVPALYQLSVNKFHLDELYLIFVVRPLEWLAALCRGVDYVVDHLFVDFLVGRSPFGLGRLFRPVQNGLVQFYALAMILGLVVFLLALASR